MPRATPNTTTSAVPPPVTGVTAAPPSSRVIEDVLCGPWPSRERIAATVETLIDILDASEVDTDREEETDLDVDEENSFNTGRAMARDDDDCEPDSDGEPDFDNERESDI